MRKCKLLKVTKSKIKEFRLGLYFRELSVVIIGVAVTFFASNLITETKEKKDLKLQLHAVYAELENNLIQVNNLNAYYAKHQRLSKYLNAFVLSPEKDYQDSINKYANFIGQIHTFVYKKGAYEMLINSGAMKNLNIRSLLLDISESYSELERCKDDLLRYNELKMSEAQKLYDLDTKTLSGNEMDITTPEFRGTFNFHLVVSRDEDDPLEEQIQKTLSVIQSYLN